MRITDVALITYDCPHLKTEQVFTALLRKDYRYAFYALPFKARNKRDPLFQHRPEQSEAVAPRVLAAKHGIPYTVCESDREIPGSADVHLILGAGILSAECVAGKRVINCHPGIIPASRGLDSFKWAILEMKPLGVTLHYIDERVDEGEVIAVQGTEVYESDTLATLARRHYENEIDILARFDEFLEAPRNPFADLARGEARMRMPREKEQQLIDAAPEYVKSYGSRHAARPPASSEALR
jgi:phosphoribosylglycinamide formyltransferase-1